MNLETKSTALILIDLQRGLVAGDLAPNSSDFVLANAAELANKFRAIGGTVVLVRVSFAPDGADRLAQPVDQATAGKMADGWDELVPEIGPKPGDILIVKHQWGAFYGTSLDSQLRRRNIDTIVLGGISTSIGVESTARDAYEHNYSVVLAVEAMTDRIPEAHQNSVSRIFPRLGRVRQTKDILAALV